MKKLLLSAAALALLSAAAPAFAQRQDGNPPHAMSERSGRDGNRGGMDRMRGPQQPQQQQTAPQRQANTDSMRGNDRGRDGNRGNQPQVRQTPQPAPQPPATMAMQRGDRDNDRNRGNWNNDRRGDNSRFDNDRRDNRGWDNRRNDNRPRADFRRYQRNFAAPQRFRAPAYRRPAGWYSHRWTFGEFLPTAFFARSYWIDNFYNFGLMDPPFGTVWVRYGSDALLIDRYTGEVIQVVYRVFY
jgi:Ni/Co efflux regulator RcnB